MNLLEKAKSFVKKPKTKKVDSQLIELSLAWLTGEITTAQASYAVNGKVIKNTYLIFGNLGKGIRSAYENGYLFVKGKKGKISKRRKFRNPHQGHSGKGKA